MKRFWRRNRNMWLLTPLVVGGTLAIVGCPMVVEQGVNEVFMRNNTFEPMIITIKAGESVTWNNRDIVPHTTTSGNPEDADFGSIFKSPLLSQGETFTYTFDEVGEFIYYCEVHPDIMRDAKVIVEAGG